MLPLERQNRILEILSERKSATVEELCATLYSSGATIRRDLTVMENAGLLRRTHGGAVYMVAFTSEAELEKGGPTIILSHFIDIYFDVVLDFEDAQGLVINPFGQPFFLQKDLLAAVLTERPVRDEE